MTESYADKARELWCLLARQINSPESNRGLRIGVDVRFKDGVLDGGMTVRLCSRDGETPSGGAVIEAHANVPAVLSVPVPEVWPVQHKSRLRRGWTDQQFIDRAVHVLREVDRLITLAAFREWLAVEVDKIPAHLLDDWYARVKKLVEESNRPKVFTQLSMDDLRYWDYEICRFAEEWLLPYNGIWNVARDKPHKRQGRDLT